MQIFSEAQKHRLKMAARLLRKESARFDNGNFYGAVTDAINKLDEAKREGLEDWVPKFVMFRHLGSTEPYGAANKKANAHTQSG